MPRIFRQRTPQIGRKIRPKDPGPREKGYDARWDRASRAFRRKHPFCARCLENGRTSLVVEGAKGVVDHKHPVSEGGPMWDPSNWWSLCNACHSGWKAKLEQFARDTGQMHLIRYWCDNPHERPAFRGDTR